MEVLLGCGSNLLREHLFDLLLKGAESSVSAKKRECVWGFEKFAAGRFTGMERRVNSDQNSSSSVCSHCCALDAESYCSARISFEVATSCSVASKQ